MGRAFNPNYGGLNHDIWLHLTGKVYQTLPLYENLKTTGIYVYPSNFSIKDKTCDVNIESQVSNESGDQQSITLSAVVVDADGKVCAKFQATPRIWSTARRKFSRPAANWRTQNSGATNNPNLYDVYSMLTVNDKVVDVQKIKTGFRKAEYKGGVGTGGVWLNDKFVWLTGYAQRSSDDWAGLGEAYPDWMHDYNAELVRSTHANYIRWMHISPQPWTCAPCDKAGIVEVCPAGDKEERHACKAAPMGTAHGSDARLDDLFPQQPEHFILGGGKQFHHRRRICGKWWICESNWIRTAGASSAAAR